MNKTKQLMKHLNQGGQITNGTVTVRKIDGDHYQCSQKDCDDETIDEHGLFHLITPNPEQWNHCMFEQE